MNRTLLDVRYAQVGQNGYLAGMGGMRARTPLEYFPGRILSPYDLLVLSRNPKLYMPGDEAWGPPQDIAGTNHVTEVNGTPVWRQPGIAAGGYSINVDEDANSYFFIPDSVNIPDSGACSYVIWFSRSWSGGWDVLISKGASGDSPMMYVDSDDLLYWRPSFGGTGCKSSTTVLGIDTGSKRMHMLAGTRDSSNNWLCYIDGVDVTVTVGTGAAVSNTNRLCIGAIEDGTGEAEGEWARLAMYDYQLSAADIAAEYALGSVTGANWPTTLAYFAPRNNGGQIPTPAALGAWYRLNEGGTPAASQWGTNPMTLVNTPTTGVTGLSGDGDTAMRFVEASAEYGTIADAADIRTGDVFTIGAIIYRDSAGIAHILNKGSTGGTGVGLWIDSTDNLRLTQSSLATSILFSLATLPINTRWFVLVSKNGSWRRCFINGEDSTDLGGTTNVQLTDSTSQMYVASLAGAATNDFDGIIDELFLLDDLALNASQAYALQQAILYTPPAGGLTIRSSQMHQLIAQ